LGCIILASCKPSASLTGSSAYSEDIGQYLPDYSDSVSSIARGGSEEINRVEIRNFPAPTHDETGDINELVKAIAISSSNIRYVNGFTVQVYSGRDKDAAQRSRQLVYSALPSARPRISYKEPNYKVRVGSFYTRLDAQKTLYKLNKVFSESAIIVPERIEIN